jgi:hypothetical protein
MDPYMVPFVIRDALLCLVFLLGVIAGLLALVRGQRKIGIYVTTGFLLLGIDPASEFIIFNFILPSFTEDVNYVVFNWAYACISAPATILGVISLVAAIYFGIRPQQSTSDIANEDVIYSSDSTGKTE